MPRKKKDPAATVLGRKGGRAHMRTMTPEQRWDSARRAALARWAKAKQKKPTEAFAGTTPALDATRRGLRVRRDL